MAELDDSGDVHSGRGKKRGGVRAKKMSTRIDMTPMVDLGFLLVTFFILTTTMQKPKAMNVVMPDKEDKDTLNKPKIRASEAMTIILGQNDKIYYYFGQDSSAEGGPSMQLTNFKNIRKIITERNELVVGLQHQNGWTNNGEYMGVYVLIKPTDSSKYVNTVDILDEMKITHVRSFAIVDITPEELSEIPK